MPEFFLNLFRARDCVGDFFPQQLAVALPHSLHGGLDGGLRHREFVAKMRIGPPTSDLLEIGNEGCELIVGDRIGT